MLGPDGGQLPALLGELERRLCGPGLALRTGPVVTRIRSPLAAVAQGIALFYDEHRLDEEFADFEVRIASPRGVRRWLNHLFAANFRNLLESFRLAMQQHGFGGRHRTSANSD